MLLNDGTCSLWATGMPTVTPAPCTGPPTLHTRKRPHPVQDVTYSKVGNLLYRSVRYRCWYLHNFCVSFTSVSNRTTQYVRPLPVHVKAWPYSRTGSVNFFVPQTITHSDLSRSGALNRLGSGFKLITSDDQHALFQHAASSALPASCVLRLASSWRSSAQITPESATVCVCLLRAGQSEIRSKCSSNWVGFCRAVSCGSSDPGLRSSGNYKHAQLAWSNTIVGCCIH